MATTTQSDDPDALRVSGPERRNAYVPGTASRSSSFANLDGFLLAIRTSEVWLNRVSVAGPLLHDVKPSIACAATVRMSENGMEFNGRCIPEVGNRDTGINEGESSILLFLYTWNENGSISPVPESVPCLFLSKFFLPTFFLASEAVSAVFLTGDCRHCKGNPQ